MALGWMLVMFDGYDSSVTLTLHQYLGSATALFAVGTAVAHWIFAREKARWLTTSLIILSAAMVSVTGHLGGTLVHGNLFAP
jgi:peptidoglycan/LPS O-acetylase OafA/YrhL